MSRPLAVIGSTEPWQSGLVGEHAEVVLAPNPSPMTLDGTNTWVLSAPHGPRGIIIDPGPLNDGHFAAIESALDRREIRSVEILLTHGHADHSAGAGALAERLGAPVRALDPAHRLGSEGLADGDVVTAGDLELRVVATPGHTSDSLTFLLVNDAALLTGDTLLGRGTTVVAHPDGRLDQYLASLQRLHRLAEQTEARRVLPGHGPALPEPVGLIEDYLEHRRQRLAQVRQARADGAGSPAEVVAAIYTDVPRELWPAAELSVRAQWDYLDQHPG